MQSGGGSWTRRPERRRKLLEQHAAGVMPVVGGSQVWCRRAGCCAGLNRERLHTRGEGQHAMVKTRAVLIFSCTGRRPAANQVGRDAGLNERGVLGSGAGAVIAGGGGPSYGDLWCCGKDGVEIGFLAFGGMIVAELFADRLTRSCAMVKSELGVVRFEELLPCREVGRDWSPSCQFGSSVHGNGRTSLP